MRTVQFRELRQFVLDHTFSRTVSTEGYPSPKLLLYCLYRSLYLGKENAVDVVSLFCLSDWQQIVNNLKRILITREGQGVKSALSHTAGGSAVGMVFLEWSSFNVYQKSHPLT